MDIIYSLLHINFKLRTNLDNFLLELKTTDSQILKAIFQGPITLEHLGITPSLKSLFELERAKLLAS